jgi:cysteinyl-tRNA synthetase
MGFPGWHLECSVMSSKYLGEHFDIHGGGMDLQFPHHECEIAQCNAANDVEPVKYWVHGNMLTFNGQRMSKSAGNSILPEELFKGSHELLDQPYSPNTVRFFMLQAHYRSTLDLSNEALKAADKGLKRLMQAIQLLSNLPVGQKSTMDVGKWKKDCYTAMDDDFNSPILISHLFDGVKYINNIHGEKAQISKSDLNMLSASFNDFVFDVLGLEQEADTNQDYKTDKPIELLLSLRKDARTNKNFALSDKIRDGLSKIGITIKDSKEGTTWSYEN